MYIFQLIVVVFRVFVLEIQTLYFENFLANYLQHVGYHANKSLIGYLTSILSLLELEFEILEFAKSICFEETVDVLYQWLFDFLKVEVMSTKKR